MMIAETAWRTVTLGLLGAGLVLVAGRLRTPQGTGADFYVAHDGNDANPGTWEWPFATLERARDAVRERRAAGNGEFAGATIELRGGRHFRQTSFVLGEEDAGTPEARVVFRATKGETAILDGGHVVPPDHFAPVADPAVRERLLPEVRERVLQLDLRALGIEDYGDFGPRGWGRPDISAPMELFLDGVPQTIARWPNEGSVPLGKVLDGGSRPRDGDTEGRDAVFHYNTERAERWIHAEDLFISGLFGVTWGHDTIRIRRIDTEAGTFTTEGPHSYGFRQPGFPGNFETHYYAVNLLEEIERPGEYYINRTAGVLYFLPPYPIDYSRIQLSSLEAPFMLLDGTSHVQIEGLVFENSRGMAIHIRDGEANRIAGCTLRALGHRAVTISGGRGHQILGCDIHHVGTGGISMSGGTRQTLEPGGHLVRNCDIHNFNRWIRQYNPAISAGGVGLTIEHNHLHHALHQAVTFGGNDHRIAKNEIHHVLQDISDMGSIYVGRNPTFAGNVIEHNFFHHLFPPHRRGPGVQAIFFDDDTVFVAKVFGNVFYRTGSSGVVKFHGGGGAPIANNIAIAGARLIQDTPGRDQGMARALSKMRTDHPHRHGFPAMLKEMNISEPPFRTRYPYLHDFYTGAYHPYLLDPKDPGAGTRAPRWNNFETHDDLSHFVDPENLDFRLREDSPLLHLVAENVYDRVTGVENQDMPFQPIPFEEIGLLRDEFRPELGPKPFAKLGPANTGDGVPADAATFWWAPSPGADTYRLTIAEDASLRRIVHEEEVGTNHLTTDRLEPGRTYYWQVSASVTRSRSNRGTRSAAEGPWRVRTAI